MSVASFVALSVAMIGGSKLVLDVFRVGLENSLGSLPAKAFVVGLAYTVGWVFAMVAVRIYGNLIVPLMIKIFMQICLLGVCILILVVLQRLYIQNYDLLHYSAYILMVAAGFGALVGLHLIIEGHNLRPFAIPLLIISIIHLVLIVYRYVFTEANPEYLWGDLLFFLGISAFGFLMLAHLGLLTPLRTYVADYFAQINTVIGPED